MNPTTAPPSSQPSLGSDFEPRSMEEVIADAITAFSERGESADMLAREIARITREFTKDAPLLERAAQCPKCRERTGFRTIRSTWLDMGKSRERVCRNQACGYFFRTFEPFPKYEEERNGKR
jgi:hypothetical protein